MIGQDLCARIHNETKIILDSTRSLELLGHEDHAIKNHTFTEFPLVTSDGIQQPQSVGRSASVSRQNRLTGPFNCGAPNGAISTAAHFLFRDSLIPLRIPLTTTWPAMLLYMYDVDGL